MNGIGGATVAEARESVSAAELEMWRAYREQNGTLNLGLRIEVGSALVAFFANGRVGTLDDYLPKRGPQHGDAALDAAMKEWR
ncbi:MAG: hypothetical protein I8H71_01035 [Xanthomonadaceae bacterium]|nr:hypothetical protein [Xanthomonadaceae bacterium]